jgi:hypothetical protein
MSYKLYLDGLDMEIKDINRLAQTKQVNNIVNLHTRQTNATNNFALPKTADNIKKLKALGIIGNLSDKPYSKVSADLLDTITGEWLIYKGWAIINETSTDFKISLYDGVIDLYKKIDNKKLTELDLSGLDHLKTLANIVASWQNNLPYMYILADYNGKLYSGLDVNADYQIPSARMSYIWDRLHQYAGFTYSGSVFQTEKFLNWFMTYPKPITDASIQVIPITAQSCQIEYFTNANGETFQNVLYLPQTIPPNIYGNLNPQGAFLVQTSGSFRVKITGVETNLVNNQVFNMVNYIVYDSANTVIQQGDIDGQANEVIFLSLNAGERLVFWDMTYGGPGTYMVTSQQVFIDYVDGYVANFNEALIDFTASEFYKEVLNHFALIPFKEKYSNHIVYKKLSEVMQETGILDWSDKNPVKLTEKYIVGSYGQANEFTYKYNQEGFTHNNGVLDIANKNLKEKNIAIASRFYTPDNKYSAIENNSVPVMPIWEKELKDDGTIEYKDLSGRYYTHRAENVPLITFTLRSELLNVSQLVGGPVPFSSYFRLKWSEILLDNYEDISKVLNTSKIVEANLFLSSKDVADFDFQRLIYIEQFASYYIVNKISNFIKDKYTKVELIEVDYFIEGDQEFVAPFTYITITDVIMNGCTMTVTIDTDASFPVVLYLDVRQTPFAVNGAPVVVESYTITATSNVFTFTYTGFSQPLTTDGLQLWLGASNIFYGIPSNIFPISLDSCIIQANGTFLTLNSITTLEIIPQFLSSNRRIKVFFTTDVPLPTPIRFWYVDIWQQSNFVDVTATANNFEVIIPNAGLFGGNIYYTCYLQIANLISNQLPSQ